MCICGTHTKHWSGVHQAMCFSSINHEQRMRVHDMRYRLLYVCFYSSFHSVVVCVITTNSVFCLRMLQLTRTHTYASNLNLCSGNFSLVPSFLCAYTIKSRKYNANRSYSMENAKRMKTCSKTKTPTESERVDDSLISMRASVVALVN